MRTKITKRSVETVVPTVRDVFLWDTELPGFGCKVTPKGSRVYVLQYRVAGRARRYTIGPHGPITPDKARRRARTLRGLVADGVDPAEEREQERAAPTLAEFADRYLTEHARPKKKPASVAEDLRNLHNHILPALGRMKLTKITRSDIAGFHHGMRAKPSAANRCVALLSKMFNLAEKWGLRPDGTNPTRHIEKYPERKIERYLSSIELARLGTVLRDAERGGENPSVIAAIRLLLFTGCRRNEILKLKWEEVDFERGCLRLPDTKTGAKLIPIGAPALELLKTLPRQEGNSYVLPGKHPARHFVGLEKAWQRLRRRAELDDLRLHDLRHSFASAAASLGEGLQLIGALLGHAEQSSTARYAHLSTGPLKAAADRISKQLDTALRKSPDNVIMLKSVGR